MSEIQWLLFSKERTLQAKSCILSLISLSEVKPEEITVLYVDSPRVSYEPLKKEFPCRFVRQTDFYQDVIDILNSDPKSFIGFLVDDLIFRERFSCAEIESLMKEHNLDCFSLRLGKNIRDGRPPEFEEPKPGILSWKTAKGLGRTWNYFWELSSSIYRKDFVLDYLRRCPKEKISFPNPMEFLYYSLMPNLFIGSRGISGILTHPQYLLWVLSSPQKMIKRMACYKKSRSFTQGINLVAERNQGYKTYIEPERLHQLYLNGYWIDFKCLKDVTVTKPNAGRKYLRLVGPQGEIHPWSLY